VTYSVEYVYVVECRPVVALSKANVKDELGSAGLWPGVGVWVVRSAASRQCGQRKILYFTISIRHGLKLVPSPVGNRESDCVGRP
jgi:hypothetical protein